MTSITTLQSYATELKDSGLSGRAAGAALNKLLPNWADAIAAGNADKLPGDVDDVIAHLLRFRTEALASLPEARAYHAPETVGYQLPACWGPLLGQDLVRLWAHTPLGEAVLALVRPVDLIATTAKPELASEMQRHVALYCRNLASSA